MYAELTGSAAVFAGMLALAMVPTILLSPFGGMLADRCDRRKLMAAMDAVSGAAVLLSVPAVRYLGGTLPAGALLVVLSVLGAFESPGPRLALQQLARGNNIPRGKPVAEPDTGAGWVGDAVSGQRCTRRWDWRRYCSRRGCVFG